MKRTPLKRKTPLARTEWVRKPPKNPKKGNTSHVKRPKPKKNAELYARWCDDHDFCQCCGIAKELASFMRFPGLSTHHICKAGRVHHPANLIRLCARCHDLAEGLDTPMWLPDGSKWYPPKLRTTHMMWLKRSREPKEYDEAVLRKLHMRPLPELEPVPGVFNIEYLARQKDIFPTGTISDSGFSGTIFDLLNARMQPKGG